MTGWRIGAKEFEECNRETRKAAIYGIITATCFSVTFAFAGHFIVHIFTDDIQMINLVVKLLIVDIFLEFGRVTNLVYGQALKTSGDAVFPVMLGAIFMYLFAVGGTYFLGIHMGLLAVGAFLAMAGDLGGAVGPGIVGLVTQAANDNLKIGVLAGCVFPAVLVLSVLLLKRKREKV